MNQFSLQQGKSEELLPFPFIIEFSCKKNQTVQLHSFPLQQCENILIYHIIEGKFEWYINHQHHILYPGDTVLILPGQPFGGKNDFFDIGTLSWIHIRPDSFGPPGQPVPGKWSGLSEMESKTLWKILTLNNTPVLSNLKTAGDTLQLLHRELFTQEIGFSTRVGDLVDELFIILARQLSLQNNSYRNFPQTFMKLEQALRENLSHQWSVVEMAALVGLGTTAFTEKVKNYTGFSPLNYLINIRISEAMRLLKRPDVKLTDIALDTGFYSSQHFSTTFKKLTGYTPSQFRKNIIDNSNS